MNITDPIYSDPNKAREHLEKLLWPNGPFCPHCGNADPGRIAKLEGKSTRPGVYKCNECEKPFSVTVGTVFESSHVPLNKWLYATHKLNSGKKGTSAHQLHRELGVSYKTAWFMAHRIREAMAPATPSPLGGEGRVVEADETEIGGKAKNRAYRKRLPKKAIVLSLVERGGAVRSTRVANVGGIPVEETYCLIFWRADYRMRTREKSRRPIAIAKAEREWRCCGHPPISALPSIDNRWPQNRLPQVAPKA